jgi:hypothetical protein
MPFLGSHCTPRSMHYIVEAHTVLRNCGGLIERLGGKLQCSECVDQPTGINHSVTAEMPTAEMPTIRPEPDGHLDKLHAGEE